MRRAAAALAAFMFAGMAQAEECRLALVLAMDVSSSVNEAEDALQRGGLAAALVAPEVQEAFFAAPQPVALAIYEWSGRWNQELLLDWRLILSPADLLAAAEAIARSERSQTESPTALGHALGYGSSLLDRAPPCLFQTLDMAGDGQNNEGYGPRIAYRHFNYGTVTVNGLVINGADFEGETELIPYYRENVLHGPGAFLEVAQGFEDYERAMRRKLERELRPRVIGALSGTSGDPG